jgi:phosphatidylglycerol lysyltransferase
MNARIIGKDEANLLSHKQKWVLLSPYLMQYGSECLAYSTLQKDLNYLIVEGIGYISYYHLKPSFLAPKGKNIVVAHPITSKENYEFIIKLFLKHVKEAVFIQVDKEIAKILNNLGLKVNEFGVETELELENFSIRGNKGRSFRHTINKAVAEGIKCFERSIEEMKKEDVLSISDDWVKRKGGHELILLTRPLTIKNEPGVRYFWASQNGKLIGMVIFDPILVHNRIKGYYQNFVRIKYDAPQETSDFLTIRAIEKFKAEGIKKITFGLSPLSQINDKEFNYNKIASLVCKALYNYGNFIYPFKGNELYKKKYHGEKKKVYFSTTKGNSIRDILATMKALHIF